MKKLILLIAILLVSLTTVNAQEIYTTPYSDSFSTESELGKSLDTIRTELAVKSCYVDANWQAKNCDYLYFCFAILPSTSNSIADALLKDCQDVTDKSSVTLAVKQFIPPKGVLYYVTTFITLVNYQYNDAMEVWEPTASIPTEYINAHSIRSVCPEGQMLDFDMVAGEYKCYLAKRACLNTMDTGLCTNVYNLWVLDKNEDGIISDAELVDGSNYCADRPTPENPEGDKICDIVKDLECVDVCSDFDINGNCIVSGANGLCDEWDQAVNYGCWDDVLSANSKICDELDVVGCFKTYDPVCVGGRGGTTYPNSCFAEKGQGIYRCPTDTPQSDCYILGACEPAIVQCYVPEDCPDTTVCLGGSTAGISKMCLNYMCSYTGACGNLACDSDSDCEEMNMPCVGVFPTCEGGLCVISGKCLTAPQPQKLSIWELIADKWNIFWNFIKNLFT